MEECSWQGKEHVQRPLRVREHPPPLQSQALILAGSPSVSAVVSAEPWRGSPGDLGGASEGLKHHGERFGCGSAQRNEFTEYS